MTSTVCGDRLNEGHTVFIERKIAGRMFGEQLRHFLALDGWTELRNQVCYVIVLWLIHGCYSDMVSAAVIVFLYTSGRKIS